MTNTDQQKKKSSTKGGAVEFEYEFGGPICCAFLILWSHYILYYFWYCLEFHKGSLYLPISSFEEFILFPYDLYWSIIEFALPTFTTLSCYSLFIIFECLIAQYVPSDIIYGFPVQNLKNRRLAYYINGYYCYYLSIIIIFLLHIFNIFKFDTIVTSSNFGSWLTTSIIIGDITSLYWYIYGFLTNSTEKMSGNYIYDFFMGSLMYPRIGCVDIKMIAEIRWSWLLLFIITTSSLLNQYKTYGIITPHIVFMFIAHWLYSNACVKGEHYVVYCWDMHNEKYGWMLNFWNISGVPFLYSFQSLFILRNTEYLYINNNNNNIYIHNNTYYIIFVYLLLFLAYYIWDCANSNKADFKCPQLRIYNKFPILPGYLLNNPSVIETPNGDILIDGCWKYARKMNYTGDILMALSWGLITGFNSFACYFYVIFFTLMILHRQYFRDEEHCQKKYGKYWTQYKKTVPYLLIPYII